MIDVLLDTFLDGAKLLPFLLITYLVMEFLEHKSSEKLMNTIRKAGRMGPFFGSILGAAPQCGFSAAASGLYAGRVISLGTLIAIYLSTSDEMLPIMISEMAEPGLILTILGIKIIIGMAAGFLIDFIFRKNVHIVAHDSIEKICEHDHCHCERGIFKSAVKHTLQIFIFILPVSFLLNTVIYFLGEDALAGFITNVPYLGELIAGLIGLIPNCAASVVITQLYLSGGLSFSSMLAGLLVGAGVGILVLFRMNKSKMESLRIVLLLYVTGVTAGMLCEFIGSLLK